MMLWGRRQQCRVLDELIADVRAGRSRVPGAGRAGYRNSMERLPQGWVVGRFALTMRTKRGFVIWTAFSSVRM